MKDYYVGSYQNITGGKKKKRGDMKVGTEVRMSDHEPLEAWNAESF